MKRGKREKRGKAIIGRGKGTKREKGKREKRQYETNADREKKKRKKPKRNDGSKRMERNGKEWRWRVE